MKSCSLLAGLLLVCAPGAAFADAVPTIAKDSLRLTAKGHSGATDTAKDAYGWKPYIQFRVNGPVSSGSQLWVEFGYPGKKSWVKFDCQTPEAEEGSSFTTECGAPDKDITTYAGPVDFAIHLRNELLSKTLTLFTGKGKIGKSAPVRGTNYTEYWFEQDWALPIGYVFFEKDTSHGGDVFLNVGFWYRGNPPNIEAHLFYKGKDLAKYKEAGNGPADWKPNNHQWGFADCVFLGIYPTKPDDDAYDPKFAVNANPGEYEVKALINGKLARSIKFTVGADGKIASAAAAANKLGSDKAIVPVQVLGNLEGAWDHSAWKTGAFFGNPLTGFTAAQ